MRYALAALAIGIAAASIAVSLGDRWDEFKLSEFVLPPHAAIVLVVGATGTLLLSAVYHALLLAGFQLHDARTIRVAHAYALGQLMRYIPGKVVGIVFQISMLQGKVKPASVLSTLVVHTMHDYGWTFAFCGVLLWALLSGNALPMLAFFPAVLGVYLVHRYRFSPWILGRLPIVGRHVPALEESSPTYKPASLTGVLAVTWVPTMIAIWMAFTPLLGSHDSLVAGLLYLIAAVISLAMIIVPSGLVVREAVFLWLGGWLHLPAEKLLFMAVSIRIAMILAEIATSLLLAGMDTFANHRQRTLGARH